jgi:hypothetical protein
VTASGFWWDRYVGWPLTVGLFGILVVAMVRAFRARVTSVREQAA